MPSNRQIRNMVRDGWLSVGDGLRRFDEGDMTYEQALGHAILCIRKEWESLMKRLEEIDPNIVRIIREQLVQKASFGTPGLAVEERQATRIASING